MLELDWVLALEGLWQWLVTASPWLAPMGWTALVLVLLFLWVKLKGWAKVKAVASWVQRAIKTVDQLLTLQDDITYIRGQLTNNGGSTVKDAAQTTARQTAETAEALKRVERTAKAAARTAREAKAASLITQKLFTDHIASTSTEAPPSR
ncbi:MAG: hypothetical protein LCH43_11225 [Actinobacteria bacterium]|nr:hypothetical protein [Actinomycetota bacterium]